MPGRIALLRPSSAQRPSGDSTSMITTGSVRGYCRDGGWGIREDQISVWLRGGSREAVMSACHNRSLVGCQQAWGLHERRPHLPVRVIGGALPPRPRLGWHRGCAAAAAELVCLRRGRRRTNGLAVEHGTQATQAAAFQPCWPCCHARRSSSPSPASRPDVRTRCHWLSAMAWPATASSSGGSSAMSDRRSWHPRGQGQDSGPDVMAGRWLTCGHDSPPKISLTQPLCAPSSPAGARRAAPPSPVAPP